jgi:6-phosphofructokinase 1
MRKRVGILVGGGDVPGLNNCLKSLTYRLIDEGYDTIGVRKGWEGLIKYNPQDPTTYGDNFIELTKAIVRPIDRTYGSFLHSSRINPLKTPQKIIPQAFQGQEDGPQDMTDHIMEVFKRLDFEALIAIGDDDMLIYAAHLSNQDLPIIGIPKTIHNNINGTDYTIGFSTSLARGVAFIHELRALAGSREQIIVVETFGVGSGFSSLMISLLAGVDRAVIPEVPYDPVKLAQLLSQDKMSNPGNYAIVTVCDGAKLNPDKSKEYLPMLSERNQTWLRQQFESTETSPKEKIIQSSGMVGSGVAAAELLQALTGEEVFIQSLTYLLRTGEPDGQDMLGAMNFAFLAARMLKEKKFGHMTAYQQKELYTSVDLNEIAKSVKTLDLDLMYDSENYKPKIDIIWAAQEL